MDSVDYDIVGFGGKRVWSHTQMISGDFISLGQYRLYKRPNICRMLMLYGHSFLKAHKFGGYGGVYGGVDGYSCTLTDKKFVLFWDEDWIEHDPLKDSTPELHAYEEKKRAWYKRKIYTFPEGWDS